MKHCISALVVAGFFAGGSWAAFGDQHGPVKGSSVTLIACVEKGQKKDTFVLTHVADMPVTRSAHGSKVVYWLDKSTARKLNAHVGHEVRVVGTITGVDEKEIEVKKDDDGALFVEIEGPGQDVRTAPGSVGVAASAPTEGKTDIKTTVVKLDVEKLEMVLERCNLTR